MSEPILIGLTGKKSAGKNTVGEFIKDWAQQNGQEAQLQGFADRLKLSFARIWVPDATLQEALAFCDTIKNIGSIKHDTIFPKDEAELFHRFGVRNSITGREALQHYGTESHRDVFGSMFWVDQLLPTSGGDRGEHIRWTGKWSPKINYAIITDLRFPNEAERIMTLGGYVFEVVRPELNEQKDAHASEIPLPEELIYDRFINDASLDELKRVIFENMDWLGNTEYEEHQKEQLGERTFHGL